MESNVNREIRNYHEGVLMGLTMRQAVCAALAAAIGAGGNSVNLYSVMQNMSETLDKKERKNAKKNRRKDKKEGELNENREEEYAV